MPPPAGFLQPRIPTQGGKKSTPQYLKETRFCATPAPGHPDPNARRVAAWRAPWGLHGASMGPPWGLPWGLHEASHGASMGLHA